MSKMSILDKCRVCLLSGAKYSIFGDVKSTESIYYMLFHCLKEKIEDKRGYPNKICVPCKSILDSVQLLIIKFKTSCKILESGLIIKQEVLHDCESESKNVFEIGLCKVEPESDSDGLESFNFEDFFIEQPEQLVKNEDEHLLEIKRKLKGLKDIDFKEKNPPKLKPKSNSKVINMKSGLPKFPHEDNSKQPKELKTLCDICGKVFDCCKKLTEHRKEIHLNQPTKCPKCPKVFSSEALQNRHRKRAHSPNKPYICDTCPSSFAYKGDLTTHIKVVHLKLRRPRKRAVCDKCNRSFCNKQMLLIHDRSTHTGLRPAVCKYCGASFFHEDYLKEHERLHTGETPHKCPICGKGFAQKGNMRSHVSHNHRLADLSAEMAKSLKPSILKILKKP